MAAITPNMFVTVVLGLFVGVGASFTGVGAAF
jgi:hypothetical protein